LDIKSQQYEEELSSHYAAIWGEERTPHTWNRGPSLPQECRVFEFAPSDKAFCWVYATCSMTPRAESTLLELFLLSPSRCQLHVELLTAIAHYHQTGARLDLGHTVNFGRPWLEGSRCSFGLISLPYLFGPQLEKARVAGRDARVLWLLPITSEERAFKIASGLSALEELFEAQHFDYLDPMRRSVVIPTT
jgi:hypothetical protein